MQTIKAIVKQTPELNGLVLTDIPMPEVKSGEVLIKIKQTAICGTDLHIYNWDAWAQKTIKTPQVLGHEFVGIVESVGANVTNVKPGQLVSGEGHILCGHCRHCIAGTPHLCRQTVSIGVNQDGVFAEYIAFPVQNLWICDERIALDILSVQDPLGNAVHTALAFDVLGEDVLVTGAGPIGLMSVPILKRAGARNIVVTDINPMRLAMAQQLGATATVDVRTQSLEDTMACLGMKEGFDVGLEMSGSHHAVKQMIDAMANGGNIAILGILPAETQVDWNKVIFNSLTLKGIYGRKMFDTWYKMSALLQSGLDKDIAPVITHHFPYADYQQGFDVMLEGKAGKVVLDWA